MTEIEALYKFYGWWQLTVGAFSFIALLSVWQHITKDQSNGEKDLGLMWLSLSVLAWAVSGLVDIAYAHALGTAVNLPDATLYEGLRSIASLSNSAFILLSLPCFRHIPKLIHPIIKSTYWRFWVLITFLFAVLLTLLMLWGIIVPARVTFIYSVDFIYAIFTLIFLGLVIWSSFEKRGLRVLAYLSAICIACTMAAQIFKLDDSDFLRLFFSCTFKTILIMLFFALTLSWVEELSKHFIPSPKDLHLVFIKKKRAPNRFQYAVILTVPPMIQTQSVNFTEKNYSLFKKFAERICQADTPKETWLEIQPKSNKAGHYDLKDYNQINRILDTILNEHKDQSNGSPEANRDYLKQALFEYNNRKIKLKVAPENIDLAEG